MELSPRQKAHIQGLFMSAPSFADFVEMRNTYIAEEEEKIRQGFINQVKAWKRSGKTYPGPFPSWFKEEMLHA